MTRCDTVRHGAAVEGDSPNAIWAIECHRPSLGGDGYPAFCGKIGDRFNYWLCMAWHYGFGSALHCCHYMLEGPKGCGKATFYHLWVGVYKFLSFSLGLLSMGGIDSPALENLCWHDFVKISVRLQALLSHLPIRAGWSETKVAFGPTWRQGTEVHQPTIVPGHSKLRDMLRTCFETAQKSEWQCKRRPWNGGRCLNIIGF